MVFGLKGMAFQHQVGGGFLMDNSSLKPHPLTYGEQCVRHLGDGIQVAISSGVAVSHVENFVKIVFVAALIVQILKCIYFITRRRLAWTIFFVYAIFASIGILFSVLVLD
jgi:hypothetical protein